LFEEAGLSPTSRRNQKLKTRQISYHQTAGVILENGQTYKTVFAYFQEWFYKAICNSVTKLIFWNWMSKVKMPQ